MRLSGGEAQRLAIARALVADAPFVVVDEASAHLDGPNEQALTAALGELGAGRSLVVIAHRLATVREADRIVVLEAGRVAETGTHEELLAAGGRYAAMLAPGRVVSDLRWWLQLARPYRGAFALGIALGIVTLASNMALLAVSGWFIASMAAAGLAAVGHQLLHAGRGHPRPGDRAHRRALSGTAGHPRCHAAAC